jgi:hypothetical protein
MKKIQKNFLFVLLPTAVLAAVLCLGAGLGYTLATRKMRSEFRSVSNSETLRALVRKTDLKQTAQAYNEPNRAEREMEDYCWSVPSVMSPFVGCGPEPGQHHNAFINSMQCRAHKELTTPKPPQTCRIFITGGSTAFGSGAPSQDRTIGGYLNAILEKELSPTTKYKYEVFTLANPSWASTHERIIIENRLLELQPDLVISFSGLNDVHWGMYGRNVLWFRTVQEEFNWRVLQWAYGVFRLQPMTDVVALDPRPVAPSLVADRLEENVRLSAFALGLKHTQYAFCLQPALAVTRKPLTDAEQKRQQSLKTIDKSISGQNYFSRCYAAIDTRLAGLKIGNFTYVNLSDAFDGINTPERIFVDSYHVGDKGNALLARSLFERLRSLLVSSQLYAAQAEPGVKPDQAERPPGGP